MDPTDPKILYIGSLSALIGADDVFLKKTVDGGENWIEKTSLGVGVGCCTLAIDRNETLFMSQGPCITRGRLFNSTSVCLGAPTVEPAGLLLL
jgi:hypothetical protein